MFPQKIGYVYDSQKDLKEIRVRVNNYVIDFPELNIAQECNRVNVR